MVAFVTLKLAFNLNKVTSLLFIPLHCVSVLG